MFSWYVRYVKTIDRYVMENLRVTGKNHLETGNCKLTKWLSKWTQASFFQFITQDFRMQLVFTKKSSFRMFLEMVKPSHPKKINPPPVFVLSFVFSKTGKPSVTVWNSKQPCDVRLRANSTRSWKQRWSSCERTPCETGYTFLVFMNPFSWKKRIAIGWTSFGWNFRTWWHHFEQNEKNEDLSLISVFF